MGVVSTKDDVIPQPLSLVLCVSFILLTGTIGPFDLKPSTWRSDEKIVPSVHHTLLWLLIRVTRRTCVNGVAGVHLARLGIENQAVG